MDMTTFTEAWGISQWSHIHKNKKEESKRKEKKTDKKIPPLPERMVLSSQQLSTNSTSRLEPAEQALPPPGRNDLEQVSIAFRSSQAWQLVF